MKPAAPALVTVIALAGAIGAVPTGPHGHVSPEAANIDWPMVHGDAGGTRYSDLREITRENVASLEVAWTYRTGDADPKNFPPSSARRSSSTA